MFHALRPSLAILPLLASTVASLAAETPFGTYADEQNIIAAICVGQLNISHAACACLAERAMQELNDAQREYLVMTVVQPPSAEKLEIAQSKTDMQTIFTFLGMAQQSCVASTAETPPQSGAQATPN